MTWLLLDQGLPRSTGPALAMQGMQAEHVADIGLSAAADVVIIERAHDKRQIVVTLDADFHTLLALRGARSPSVIRIRREGLKGPEVAELIVRVLDRVSDALKRGALVTVTEHSIRVHHLPIQPAPPESE